MKIILTIIPTDLVTNSLLSSFCLSYKPKTRIRFSAIWWSGSENVSVFFLKRVALHFTAMPNSTDFYKGIFLHIIPVRIIVPCSKLKYQKC